MPGSTILDVAIGIVFVFLLASLIASAVREGLEAWLKTRASHLEAGLREILCDPDGSGLVKHLYDHPLVNSLYSGKYVANPNLSTAVMSMTRGGNLPSYIPSRNFALALLDMAARGPQTSAATASTGPVTLDGVRANIGSIENPQVQRALLVTLDSAQGDLARAQANLEAWYNSAMDRVSGWYKRSTQGILLALGLLLAVTFNVSTVKIVQTLYNDKTAREMVVARAEKVVDSQPLKYADASKQLGDLSQFVGWPQSWSGVKAELDQHGPADLAGWILTAFAVSIGAPFWFDLLNRLIVIRSTVKPHQKSPEEASVDNGSASAPPDLLTASSLMAPPVNPTPPLPPQTFGAPLPPAPPQLAPSPDQDGCDVDTTGNPMPDELLPAATGGVR